MRITPLALGWIISVAASAHAGIQITSATVYHNYSGGSEGGELVLSSTTTGNVFSTYDGQTGVTVNIGATSGTVRVDTFGDRPEFFYVLRSNNGTIGFNSDGLFSVVPDFSGLSSSYHRYLFTLTNLDNSQLVSFKYTGEQTPPDTLRFPAPAGHYQLTWKSGNSYMAGTTGSGHATLNFTIVPEPSFAASAGLWLTMFRHARK